MDLVQLLKGTLADMFAFYLKAQYYHWNVEGPDFKQYHDLFSEIYETAYSGIDHLAEEIRTLDAYAPGSLGRFRELSKIADEDTVPSALEMVRRLALDNEVLIRSLESSITAAQESNAYGLEDFLTQRHDAHKKIGWMLRATLKL